MLIQSDNESLVQSLCDEIDQKILDYSVKENLPFEIRDIQIPGDHNKENALAAAAICTAAGISKEIILKTIAGFKGVEHRIEFVRELNGVKYYNIRRI